MNKMQKWKRHVAAEEFKNMVHVTPEEFDNFLNRYPRPLQRQVYTIGEPPLVTYHDYTLGNFPKQHVVASNFIDDFLARDGEYRLVNGQKESTWKIRKANP